MILLQVTCPYCHETRPANKYYALPQRLENVLVLRCGCGGTFASTLVLPVVSSDET